MCKYKYIDAEKLIVEIKRFSSTEYNGNTLGDDVANSALYYVLEEIIPSLQQERPKNINKLVDVDAVREDFMTKVYRVLDADPTNDRANAIIGAFDSLPTVCQEQM